MRSTIQLDIGATHLKATMQSGPPTWTSLVIRALPHKSRGLNSTANPDGPPHLHQPGKQVQAVEEIVTLPERGTNDDAAGIMVDACMQAFQALRTRCSTSLEGCRLNVRVGMAPASISVIPIDFSVASTRSNHHLQLIAQAIGQEALGANAQAQQIRWKVQADNEHLCVISLTSSLITNIQTLCKVQHLKFSSCQPAIVERLDRELAASAQIRDSRTLVWTELDASGHRHAMVNFVRVVNGSAVNAWRTVAPSLPGAASSDQLLKATIDRFLIASGAARDEQVVLCAWPSLPLESSSLAGEELQA